MNTFRLSLIVLLLSVANLTAESTEQKQYHFEHGTIIISLYTVEIKTNNSVQPTILERAQAQPGVASDNLHQSNKLLCDGQDTRAAYSSKIQNSIQRSLKYMKAKSSSLPPAHVILPLIYLNDILRSRSVGLESQGNDLIEMLISSACRDHGNDEWSRLCFKIVKAYEGFSSKSIFPRELLDGEVAAFNPNLKSLIGKELDVLSGALNRKCQLDLIDRCQVAKECEFFFDEKPQTTYMLTHQLLMRIFAKSLQCEATNKYLENSITVEHQLCAKMYLEAELVSKLGYPEYLRDVFAEYVGLCGSIGYSNFFRKDWVDAILSWQSASEYGCFVADYQAVNTTDVRVPRPSTEFEIQHGMESTENCRSHFTGVNLYALVATSEYLHKC